MVSIARLFFNLCWHKGSLLVSSGTQGSVHHFCNTYYSFKCERPCFIHGFSASQIQQCVSLFLCRFLAVSCCNENVIFFYLKNLLIFSNIFPAHNRVGSMQSFCHSYIMPPWICQNHNLVQWKMRSSKKICIIWQPRNARTTQCHLMFLLITMVLKSAWKLTEVLEEV